MSFSTPHSAVIANLESTEHRELLSTFLKFFHITTSSLEVSSLLRLLQVVIN
jgi:hypothetical protein